MFATLLNRFKRIRILFITLILIGLSIIYLQSSLYIQHKNDITQTLLDYLKDGSEDNVEKEDFFKSLTTSELDISSPKDLKNAIKDHINHNANKVSQSFYKPLIHQFYKVKEQIPELKLVRNSDNAMGKLINKELLNEFLEIDDNTIQSLKSIHKKLYDLIPNEFPKDLYKGTGIVFIAGGKYTWLTLLSIKSLRYFGCELPVEVLIPNQSEYEYEFCNEILPTLNSKCITLSNVFGDEIVDNIKFGGYQFKSLALLASSFDNTLLLDSDNIIISNPEEIFNKEPFVSKGLIIWPDYWKRTTSPKFYDIAEISINETLRVRNGVWNLIEPELLTLNESAEHDYHEFQGTIPDVSSESGQLFIRKTDHVKTVLLSFIYNLYGPSCFYKLISQGNTGEGDKDTFIAAAVKSNEPFYQVKTGIHTFGWFGSDGGFHGVAMGQRNPIQDYEQYLKYQQELVDLGSKDARFNRDNKVKIFTIHSNFPKLDPLDLLKNNKLKHNGNPIRMYGKDISKILFNNSIDFEMVQFKRMKYLICDLNLNLKQFNGISRNELCEFITDHVKFLETSPMDK